MNHRIAMQKRFSLLALNKRPVTDLAELCDDIAESFRDLCPHIRAAAMNAATAQRAADDYRATLAALLAAANVRQASSLPAQGGRQDACLTNADLLDAATRPPLVDGYADDVVRAAHEQHCACMGELGRPALTLHQFLPQFRARMMRAARLSETQP